ncbi:MAG TPA: RNase adapter RapZ [Acetobacteraceae bacterium]|jgi:UPF0042 nucleotide-binding protein|nr:RNase adapter RapZ [Acetobacteraceae bacterium]
MNRGSQGGGCPDAGFEAAGCQSVLLVTGLSGAGKLSVLRALEDLGYAAVDNPPLPLVDRLVAAGGRKIAIGIDARTIGFDAASVLAARDRLRAGPAPRTELVYVWAEDGVLMRRYTECRRRHPLAPEGRVRDGIAAEDALTASLREAADLVIDTSDLPLAGLRRLIETRFGEAGLGPEGMTVSLVSFAYRAGLPRDADLVFDARFLRNPHYDPVLRPHTGLDPEVASYIAADPDYAAFLATLRGLLALVLPRFVHEGKKYTTIAIGCTGGRHRSVSLIEALAAHLRAPEGGGWRLTVTHRELARQEEAADPRSPHAAAPREVQAQEA